jgi:hypothetical protein
MLHGAVQHRSIAQQIISLCERLLQVQDASAAQADLSMQLDSATKGAAQWGGFTDSQLTQVAQVRAQLWHVLRVLCCLMSLLAALHMYWCAVAYTFNSTP